MANLEKNRKCFKCGLTPANDGVKLFRFPKPGIRNLIRCKLWAKYVFPEKNCCSTILQNNLHTEHQMLCQKHFNDADFTDESKERLLRSAVPCDLQTTNAVSNGAKIKSDDVNSLKHDTEYNSDDNDSDRCYDGDANVQNPTDSEDDLYLPKIKMPAEIGKCKCCMGSSKLKSMWQEHTSGELPEFGTMLVECFALPWSKPDTKTNMEKICESCIGKLKDAVRFKREVLASEKLMRLHLAGEMLSSVEEKYCDKSNDDHDDDNVSDKSNDDHDDDNVSDKSSDDHDDNNFCDKSNDSHDKDNVQFDVATEYLDYEYLDLDFVSGDETQGDHNRDSIGDTFVLERSCVNKDTQRRNQLVTSFRKRKHSADITRSHTVDAAAGRASSLAMKRSKGSNKEISNGKTDNECKTQINEIRSMKTVGYLQDILRYSNATTIGDVTPEGFKCCYCRDKYDSPGNLKHHTLDKHAEKVIINTVDDHIKLDITNLKCLDCTANVDSLHGLVRHMQIEHRMKMRMDIHTPLVPFKFDSEVLKCALCDVKFENFDVLNKHTIKHFEYYGKFSNFNIPQR